MQAQLLERRKLRGRHPVVALLEGLPPDMAALAASMLQPDPARRITAGAALRHRFFSPPAAEPSSPGGSSYRSAASSSLSSTASAIK